MKIWSAFFYFLSCSKINDLDSSYEIVKNLDRIFKQRANKNVTYGDFHAVFLTADNDTLKISKSIYFAEHNIPSLFLAINVYDLSGIIWLKLQKNFSSQNTTLHPVDMILKSKLALHGILQNTIHEQYQKLEADINKGIRTLEDSVPIMTVLREFDFKADNLTPENVDNILNAISEERILERAEKFKSLEEELNVKTQELENNLIKQAEIDNSLKKLTTTSNKISKEKIIIQNEINYDKSNYKSNIKKIRQYCQYVIDLIFILSILFFIWKLPFNNLKKLIDIGSNLSILITILNYFLPSLTFIAIRKKTGNLIFMMIDCPYKRKILTKIKQKKYMYKKLLSLENSTKVINQGSRS